MGRLREINTKAQFAFSPVSTFIATGTAAGVLSDDLSGEASIEIYDTKLDTADTETFTLTASGSQVISERCVSIAWGAVSNDRPQGVIAAAMDNGSVDLWDPVAILAGSSQEKALIVRGTAHTGSVKCVAFNSVQTNLLASAGSKGEFFVWDVTKPLATPASYKSTRLDEVTSLAWNNKVGHIIALGGKSGALSVWDLRKKSELIHIPTRFSISSIAWHPTEPTILTTASADDHDPVIQVWDLRNANAPKATMTGHDKGVLSLSWCHKDADLLLSSACDNRTLIWNPMKGEIVAELPASSQWVHKVGWSAAQPSIVANAALDGKLSIYSIQDTSTAKIVASVEETPAGDDFFDSIPKNFQAQTTSFTLKQTPKWLKRPIGASFGLGGISAQFRSGSNKVELINHQMSKNAANSARDIETALKEKSISELCALGRSNASKSEIQDWDVIETLVQDEARNALLKYLGFTKEDVEKDVINKVAAQESAMISDKVEKPTTIETDKNDEASIFGNDGGDDDFLGIINSAAENPKPDAGEAYGSSAPESEFEIISQNTSETDKLITQAILTGQFDSAIQVCLKEDRLSDAFMLALCGGTESQETVRKAYFRKTKVSYGRLLSSIIAGDLPDVARNANLSGWREVLAILCNYAKPDDFSDLCEILGRRLESHQGDQENAMLCYLAGARLDHLARIWSQTQAAEEANQLSGESEKSPAEIHTASLSKLIQKITIFRKAVAFVDLQEKAEGNGFVLSILYSKYLEFAELLSAEGENALALNYVNLVPASYDGVEALKKRLAGPEIIRAAKVANPKNTGIRSPYTVPQVLSQVPNQSQTVPDKPRSLYAPAQHNTNARPLAAQDPAAPISSPYQAQSTTISNPYAPTISQTLAQAPAAYNQQQQPYGTTQYHKPQQASMQHNNFAPPPRLTSTGPTILPAAQRKDITPWNDAPDLPPSTGRRATPVITRPAITSPFNGQPTPALSSFGPPQAQPLPPPPKSRSPAPSRPQASQMQNPVASAPSRVSSNTYAPQPPAQSPNGNNHVQASASPHNAYAQQPSAINTNIAPTPAQLQQAPANLANTFAPPPPAAANSNALFAPPPKSMTGPPKSGSAKPQSPVIKSPTITRGVALSREPSRQNSPVNTQPEMPAAKYPAGDRSHIPESDNGIVADLSALLQQLQSVCPPKYKRPLEDTGRRLSILFDQLNNTQLSDGTREQLRIMSRAMASADWGRGYAIHMELTSDKMHECRDWIVGIKTLIVVGKKSREENW